MAFSASFLILDNINKKNELAGRKEQELRELTSLCRRYQEIHTSNKEIIERISKNGSNFELLSYLEEISKKVGINEKISFMKPYESSPDETSASLELKNLNMDELIEYLDNIVNSDKILLIRKMQIKVIDSKQQKSLEASFLVTTLKSS